MKNQDNLRRRLVSDIFHEIRTPLNVLQNNLEAMIDGVVPVNQERLNYLNQEVIRFGRLLNNLNILKEFESESIKLNSEPVFLDELIRDICQEFYVASENKKINLSYDINDNSEYLIDGDKSRHKIEGSGIGLTIVKSIIQFHYATIDVRSEEGQSTTFSIYFERKTID